MHRTNKWPPWHQFRINNHMPSQLIIEPTNNPLHINNNDNNNNNNDINCNNNNKENGDQIGNLIPFLCHIVVYYDICYMAH